MPLIFSQTKQPQKPKLRAQHILDAVSGTAVSAASTCLGNLTQLIYNMLEGSLDASIAPWLSGAPRTALKNILVASDQFQWVRSGIVLPVEFVVLLYKTLPDVFLHIAR